jgi:predicted nucleic acid-binding protein
MPVASFYDTNILLYGLSTEPAEAGKRSEARRLLARSDWGLSIQVLQEFYVNATRPPRSALTHDDAVAAIRALLVRPCAVTDERVLMAAMTVRERWRLSFWDAAIVAAAKSLGARTLYSEDLNHGQEFDGLRVVNPFAGG